MPLDVLFAWELGGGLGHIARLKPLAEAMQRKGLSVAFAVRDVRFCSRVFGSGKRVGEGESGSGGEEIRWYQAPFKIDRARNESDRSRMSRS